MIYYYKLHHLLIVTQTIRDLFGLQMHVPEDTTNM